MTISTLEDMFVYQLEEMYYVENELVGVLGDFTSDANTGQLRTAFQEHQEETRTHIKRIESVFDALDRQPQQRESRVFDALVEERSEFRSEAQNEELHDLFDIQAGMKTERIEMTGYQGLIALAKKMDYDDDDVVDPLQDNLSSERSAFHELQGLSEGSKLKSMVSRLIS